MHVRYKTLSSGSSLVPLINPFESTHAHHKQPPSSKPSSQRAQRPWQAHVDGQSWLFEMPNVLDYRHIQPIGGRYFTFYRNRFLFRGEGKVARTLLVHRRDGNVVPEVAFQTRSPRHHEKSESLKWDHREVDPVTGSFQNHGDPQR
jgi:hypothetical protein